VSIFYIVAAVCSLLLVVYAWFMFLPQFENELEYSFVRDIITVITVLLAAAAGIQIYLAIEKKAPEDDKPTEK
jgi:hypothetical protein